jgi:hypothetical protein
MRPDVIGKAVSNPRRKIAWMLAASTWACPPG